MAYETAIKTIWRSDRKRSLTVVRRGSLFSYEEDGEQFDLGEPYWGPMSIGGLFDSADAADASASIEIIWLRDQNSN